MYMYMYMYVSMLAASLALHIHTHFIFVSHFLLLWPLPYSFFLHFPCTCQWSLTFSCSFCSLFSFSLLFPSPSFAPPFCILPSLFLFGHTLLSLQMQQKLTGLEEQIRLATMEKDHVLSELLHAQEEAEQSKTAVHNLQAVLEQFQKGLWCSSPLLCTLDITSLMVDTCMMCGYSHPSMFSSS